MTLKFEEQFPFGKFLFTWDSRNGELPCCKNITFSEISVSSLVCLNKWGWVGKEEVDSFQKGKLGKRVLSLCYSYNRHSFFFSEEVNYYLLIWKKSETISKLNSYFQKVTDDFLKCQCLYDSNIYF